MTTSTRVSSDDSELRDVMAGIMRSRVRKAGLFGDYSGADCEMGRRVYDAARSGRGAYLYGPCGTGKTYAAACAVRLAVMDGRKARLVSVSRLLEDARREYDGGERGVLDRAARTWLLALDDLGAERPTEWAIERVCDLVDYRVMRNLPTIFTSNYRLGDIRNRFGDVEGMRVASRIGGACEIIEVGGKDRRISS